MAKPFMCGDEPATYIPAGGCDCNYTIQEYDYEDETDYKLLQDGGQVGDTIVVPKIDTECNCNYMINSLEVSDPDQYVAQYALVQDGVVSGDIINIPKQEGGGGGGDDCNCDYRIEAVSTSTYQVAYKLTLDGVQKGAGINIPKYPSPEIVETHHYTVSGLNPNVDDTIIWRKWSDGTAEFHRSVHFPARQGYATGVEGIYWTQVTDRGFPTGLFIAKPYALADGEWGTGFSVASMGEYDKDNFDVKFMKLDQSSATGWARVYAFGMWKTIS